MTDTQRFIDDVLPEAEAASKALGIPVAPILAQWINETGSGGSKAWKNGHNPAGISIMEPQMARLGARIPRGWDQVLAFPSVQHGLLAYIIRWREPVYAATRQKWAENNDPVAVAIAMQDSPWAGGHYAHHGLVDLITEHGLVRYDSVGTGGPPAPVPAPPGSPAPSGAPCGALAPGPGPGGRPVLKVGSRGAAVREIQQALRMAGFKPRNSYDASGAPDGIFGPHTAEAVAEFQTAHGLHRDGIVGRQVYCAFGMK